MLNKFLQDVFFGVLGTVVILMLFSYILMFGEIPSQKVIKATISTSSNQDRVKDYISESFISFGFNGNYVSQTSKDTTLIGRYGNQTEKDSSNSSLLYIDQKTDLRTEFQVSSENLISLTNPDKKDTEININLDLYVGDSFAASAIKKTITLDQLISIHDKMMRSASDQIIPLFSFRIIRINNNEFSLQEIQNLQ